MTASPAEHEPAPTGADTGNDGGSPPPQDGSSARLEAIQAVLEGKAPASGGEETTAEPSGEAAGAEAATETPATETPPEPKADAEPGSEIDQDPKTPEKTRQRIGHLLGERAQLRTENEQLKAKAEVAERMDAFIQSAGLSRDEVNAGFDLMRDLKRNPAEFLKRIAPYVEKAELAAGVRLPEPIARKVEDGALDEESAKELAAARRQLEELQGAQAKARADALKANADAVGRTIDEYEEKWKGEDPAFATKVELAGAMFKTEFDRKRAAGEVITPQVARQMLQTAREKVDKALGGVAPAKTSTRPDPGARRATPAVRNGGPASRLELIQSVLEGRPG